MKAIRVSTFGGPEVMKLEDVAAPAPGTGEVLVRIKAAGVNPLDTYVRSGSYARLPPLPYSPGYDAAGLVEAVGDGVRGLAAGDRVYVAGVGVKHTGSYAELMVCDQEGIGRLPEPYTFAQGAALGVPYFTAARALFDHSRYQPGETVFVHGGSGGVGIAALQFARAAGAVTIGSASSPRGRELVTAQGAMAVDHSAADYEKQILDLTGGRGVDIVIEMLANVNLVRDFQFLATGGRVMVVGNRGSIDFNPRLAMAKDATIQGMTMWNVTAAARKGLFARVNGGLAAGFLQPTIGREFPVSAAAAAHDAVLAAGAFGKIVLLP